MAIILVATYMNSSVYPAVGTLACWTSGGYAQTCPASATSGIIGIAAANPTAAIGTTNYVQIVRMGTALCQFPSTATQGDYVVASSTGGECADAGNSYPAASQAVGIVVSGSSGGGYYVFTMNDQQASASSFALQSFSSFAGVQGDVALDTTNDRVLFGAGSSGSPLTLVASTSPLGLVPAPSMPSHDTICWKHTDPFGCDNAGSGGLHYFQSHLGLPAGFFSAAGRTVRLTYNFSINSNTSGAGALPTTSFSLSYTANSVTTQIYTSEANTLPYALTSQQVQVVCTVSGTGATSSIAATLYANCTSGVVGSGTVAGSNLNYFPLLAYNIATVQTALDTYDSGESLDLGLDYEGASPLNGDNVTILNVIPEFIQ
jgi:hypothetical protein